MAANLDQGNPPTHEHLPKPLTITTTATAIIDNNNSNNYTIVNDGDNVVNVAYIRLSLVGSIAIFASFNNIINMVIFSRLGLKDGMSVGLMALSLTDFFSSFACLSSVAYLIMYECFPRAAINHLLIENVSFGWARDVFFLCSGWIMTLLSVERCICVTFPFKVKQIFTRNRCIVVVLVIYIVHASVYAPIFASHWLEWVNLELTTEVPSTSDIGIESTSNIDSTTDFSSNSGLSTSSPEDDNNIPTEFVRKLVVAYSYNRKQIMLYNDIVTGALLPIPSQVLVLISVVWMIHGLRQSSSVRSSSRNETGTGNGDFVVKKNETSFDAKSGRAKLSQSENRLVKVVLLLAIILTICNIPRFLAINVKQIFPEVNFGRKLASVHAMLWTVAIWAMMTNASVNVFVYLAVNRSYRSEFRKIFLLQCFERKHQ